MQSKAFYFSFYSDFIIIFFYLKHLFPPPLSFPPEGIQAPQPAISQPAAAFGHHWVSSYSHIRQTVCRDGLRHLGQRRDLFFYPACRSYTSFLHSPTRQHTVLLFYVGPCLVSLHLLLFSAFPHFIRPPSSFPLFITLKKSFFKRSWWVIIVIAVFFKMLPI